jgi:zinc/manganese transport system substrate-binding protein
MQRLARSAVSRRQVMAGLAAGLTLTGPSRAQAPLPVVASFSILADLVRQASGPRVGVVSLVGPGADVHVYDPTPDAAQKLAGARLVVINGLGLEGWIERLVRSAGAKAPIVTASDGITPRTIQIRGETRVVDDPHAWQSVANA